MKTIGELLTLCNKWIELNDEKSRRISERVDAAPLKRGHISRDDTLHIGDHHKIGKIAKDVEEEFGYYEKLINIQNELGVEDQFEDMGEMGNMTGSFIRTLKSILEKK